MGIYSCIPHIWTSGRLHVSEVEIIGICEMNNRFLSIRNGLWTMQHIYKHGNLRK